MKVLDPGHVYRFDQYNGPMPSGLPQTLWFANAGSFGGTNLQEVIRALIDRVRHLDGQEQCLENKMVVMNLKWCLWHLETVAARRSGASLLDVAFDGIELRPTCLTCGHITCGGHGS